MRRCSAGHNRAIAGAFAQIVQIYQDRIYNAVLRMVGDHEEARDLAQETFTRALVKIDSFRGEAQPYTWLFRIALNLAISQLRKTHRRRTFTLGDSSAGSMVERVRLVTIRLRACSTASRRIAVR
jgi:RNA polymerase sigma-70 factor (ECF subfamily)